MIRHAFALPLAGLLLGCTPALPVGSSDTVLAPAAAGRSAVDALQVGHRAMAAGEYEVALRAYYRAVGQQGLNADTLAAMGSANLALGRLGQAETWLRRAVENDPSFPPAWNNLGVVLIERGNIAEASEAFRRAFALDDGQSDEIRENLRIALALLDNSGDNIPQNEAPFTLIRRGYGDFVLSSNT